MLLDLVIALCLGVFIGIFTGLAPGVHVNLVSVLVVSFAPILLQFTSPLTLGVFIISLAITHTFLDTLPSIYLGAPDEGMVLNVLPGHRFLLRGEGHSAVIYTIIGSFGSLILSLILFPIFIVAMIYLQPFIGTSIGYILIAIMIYMIAREKKWLAALVAFLLSGCLGLIVFSIPTLRQPLLPLLSGLFGISLLLTSLAQKSTIPKQKTEVPVHISPAIAAKSVSAATGMGFIAAFLPGFGSSQAAIIATNIVGDIKEEGFLSLVGGINTANVAISIAAAYALDKARNGAIVAVKELLGQVTLEQMMTFVAVALIAGGMATILTLLLSRVFAKMIVKVDYPKLIIGIIIFVTVLTIYFDGWLGLTILATATAIGLLTSSWGVGKNHLMGCLLLPVILYFIL